MKPKKIGLALYLIGIAVMIGDVVYGRQIQDQVAALGIAGIQARDGDVGGLKLLAFAFLFPLGVAVSVMGAALFAGAARTPVGRLGALTLFVVLVPILTPGVFGTGHSPGYFGYGGTLILALIAVSVWHWGRYRMRLNDAKRQAADWQGLGYLAFALAAWNLCGVGGMPGFAVYPQKMIDLNAIPFAVGQLKAVMALFIIGWVFTALGLRRAVQATP